MTTITQSPIDAAMLGGVTAAGHLSPAFDGRERLEVARRTGIRILYSSVLEQFGDVGHAAGRARPPWR